MNAQKADELVAKYNAGLADPAELREIEQAIEAGYIQITQLTDLTKLEEQLMQREASLPSFRMDEGFYEMLATEKQKSSRSFLLRIPEWNGWVPRLAMAATLLLAGFLAGYWLQSPSSKTEVAKLTQEVTDLKEMMLLSLLEKESAAERLRAVSLTSDMTEASQKITMALIQTLNQDPNVNVRLAALDALRAYAKDGGVREELVRSISIQDSPLVQVALAELMVMLQEKKSVKELEKLLKSDRTPTEVKSRIKESINVLI